MPTVTRVYLTLTPAQLAALAADRELDGTELLAFAVTPAVRAAYPQEDLEGWEFLALQDAAVATAPEQRVLVAAADVVTTVEPHAAESPCAVTVSGSVPLPRVVSFHVGDEGVRPAPEVETELSWYDVTELEDVRRLFDD